MLTEERQKKILELLETQGSVEATDLMAALEASESTIRRDLNAMDAAGLLTKVHGGAIAKGNDDYVTKDDDISLRKTRNISEKKAIAQFAASLIKDNDFVYMDAGSTTELMVDYITAKNVTFVTNAINHATRLSAKGYTTYLIGGQFKSVTEALVGEEAISAVEKYNFTKGFFGTNGLTVDQGFTTPELQEAMIKKKALESSREAYVLMDSSKFGEISPVTFSPISAATIITDKCPQDYAAIENIISTI